jgi:glycosyltransferase involved in cell wall biosynthesis
MSLEIALYIVYLFAGPLLWLLFSYGMAVSRRRMNLLKKPAAPLAEPFPHVTILIPAKDEGRRIAECLASALGQDYPEFDVLAIDDRSGDETGKIMDEMANADPRLKVIHVTDLPPGWTGKNHALHRGAMDARGQWLLFIDSDVILQPQALGATLNLAVGRRYDMLSLILRHETRGMWESVLVPIASAAFGSAHLMGLGNSKGKRRYFGNGQFMLIRRDVYDRIGGHEAVRNQYNEDMTLARIMKRSGFRPRMAWGIELGSVRMYDSLATIMRGWSRIFFGSSCGSPWRSLCVMLFILFGCYSAYAAAAWGIYDLIHSNDRMMGIAWLAAATVHWTMTTVQLGIIYRWMGTRAIYAAAFFVSGWFVLVMLCRAIWMCLTRRVDWRGTSYSHPIGLADPTKP